MKGYGSSVTPLTSGVRSDVERLLQKFIDLPSVRFEHFARCFKEMHFSLIFSGRTSENELREFAEKTFQIVLSFCFPPYSFQVNVGGLYLLYSLYYIQPVRFRMLIRVTPEQVESLKTLMNDFKEQQHLDTCFVLCKLFRDHAFHISAYPDEHNLLNYHRFDSKEDVEKAVENLRNTETFVNEFASDRLIPQLETLHEQYAQLKKRLYENEQLPEALDLVKENPMEFVKNVISECETELESRGPTKKKKLCADKTEEIEIEEAKGRQKLKEHRSAIKDRAYRSKISKKKGAAAVEKTET